MSEQQATASITVSAAIRQALESGCETNAAILSSVQAATGKIPSPSTISVIRKKLGKPANSGRGRPLKSAVKAVPAEVQAVTKSQARRHEFQKNHVNIASVHAPQVVTAIQSTSAEDFVAIAKAIQPFRLKFSSESLLSLVESAISL